MYWRPQGRRAVYGRALSCSKTTPALSMTCRNFYSVLQSRSTFTVSSLDRKSTRRMSRPSQKTLHIAFRADKVCFNFVFKGDPLWRQCIDCYLVSRVMCVCATHVSSSVMIRSRNSSPPSWYRCRNVYAGDSMRFWCVLVSIALAPT